MHATEISPLTKKLAAFVGLSDGDLAVLARLHQKRRSFGAGRDLVREGQTEQSAYVLAAGWVCSYKLQPDGKRQIIDFQIPGDFLGLRSILLRTSDHSFEPIVDILAIEVPKRDLLDAFSETPRLATAILWAASRDEAMVVEHLVRLGRRDADKRLAHFLLELWSRLTLVGMAERSGYACPLTQFYLADALGLTSVHINRTLRRLRDVGLVSTREGRVDIVDLDGLIKRAEFNQPNWIRLGRCSLDAILDRVPPSAVQVDLSISYQNQK